MRERERERLYGMFKAGRQAGEKLGLELGGGVGGGGSVQLDAREKSNASS
jgi:hypothetical protein